MRPLSAKFQPQVSSLNAHDRSQGFDFLRDVSAALQVRLIEILCDFTEFSKLLKLPRDGAENERKQKILESFSKLPTDGAKNEKIKISPKFRKMALKSGKMKRN